ncbi:GNAT family N-acetyltransferase [Nocardia abscessus]|uniref:GNAT family N-acetyltransferase n=1 Tax=Nocardia abscessus TaxID=120957 RepID=UPI002454EBC7|nr:GNAT family N-acetyltransferase [Nocardia abscessus]
MGQPRADHPALPHLRRQPRPDPRLTHTHPGTDWPRHLRHLAVAPNSRGRGVADAAVSAVLHWADGREVGLSVKADNQSAIRLYRRHGFIDTNSLDDGDGRRMLRSIGKNQPPDAS